MNHWSQSREDIQKLISLAILSVAGLLLSVALFSVVRFYTTPTVSTLSFQNQAAWLNYAIWRADLIPSAVGFVALVFVMVLLSIAVYPLQQKHRMIFTIFILVFLEEQLAVWGSWLFSHVPQPSSLWVYDPFPLLSSVMGGSVAVSFLILACAALASVQLSFRSVPKTLQIISLSLVPLPLYVYFFDRGEFYIHFQDAATSLGFITNMDLLIGCILAFSLATAYQKLRKIV